MPPVDSAIATAVGMTPASISFTATLGLGLAFGCGFSHGSSLARSSLDGIDL